MSTPVDQSLAGGPPNQPEAEIFDRGYRHYDGPREGRRHAIQALIIYSIKRGLGIKKRWTAKIIPILIYAFAFFPVLIIIGIRAFAGDAAASLSYLSLYGAISVIMVVFAAATAPEMLCDDRRQRVLPLYFSRAISRGDYLLAKIVGLGILMGTVALLPAFILFLGSTFLAKSPVTYFFDHIADLLRILAVGTLLAFLFASIGLLIAAFTERKSIAAAVYIGAVLLVAGFANALFNAINASWHRYFVLADIGSVSDGITSWIFGIPLDQDSMAGKANLNGAWYLVTVAIVVVACAAVMYRQYLREE
ncbi:MAG TPA: ABC transporter permease subunit [Nitrolancea sp.]|nr:ABC transporter permease subunit [Nitrolancea sp.]